MALFEKKKAPLTGTAVQLRDGGRHPFGVLDGYVPLRNGEIALYRAIREAVPIVDAALIKLIRLVGGVRVQCGDPRAQEGLERFLRTVPTLSLIHISHNGAGRASTWKDGSFTSSKGIGAFHMGSHSSFFNLSMACAVVRPSVYFN